MLNRARVITARALLPALLMALAFLQLPILEYSTRSTCHRLRVMRLMRSVGELTPEVDELFHAVTRWDEVTSGLLFQHGNHLWILTCVFALAYLLLASEGLVLRVAVCVLAIFGPDAFFAFGNVC